MRYLVPYAGAERRRERREIKVDDPECKLRTLPGTYTPAAMAMILDNVKARHGVSLRVLRNSTQSPKKSRALTDAIIQLMGAGYSRAHIARVLHKDPSTVSYHYERGGGRIELTKPAPPPDPDGLTIPERKVWDMLSSGQTYKQISTELSLTYTSARDYASRARKKLRRKNPADNDILEALLVWAPRVMGSVSLEAAQLMYRAAEEIKYLRGKVNG